MYHLCCRFADINPDTGIQTTASFSNAKNDVYPVNVVIDDEDGVQGSCPFYKQRKNVTKNVRTEELKQLVGLEEAVKRLVNELVRGYGMVERGNGVGIGYGFCYHFGKGIFLFYFKSDCVSTNTHCQ